MRKCRLALAKLAQMCVGAAEFPDDITELYAWGQYLEPGGRISDAEVHGQFGIYGSCAALQILTAHSFVEYTEYIQRGLLALPLVSQLQSPTGSERQIHLYYESKGDLRTAYKLAALHDISCVVQSADGSNEFQANPTAVATRLISLARPGGGWPDCSLDDGRYQAANCHATAVALLSLSRASALTSEGATACAAAVRWLAAQPLDQQSVATLSMLVVALERLKTNSTLVDQTFPGLLRDCRKELSGWLRVTGPAEVMRSLEGTDYLTPDQPDPQRGKPFQFLLYMPHCLAAIAILCSPVLRERYEHRQFARDVVRILTQRICDTGRFVAAGRQMVSTVESLWISRLLVLYVETSVSISWGRRVLDSLRRRRSSALVVFLVVLLLGTPIAVIFTTGVVQALLGVMSTVILGLVTGVVAALFVEWLKRQ